MDNAIVKFIIPESNEEIKFNFNLEGDALKYDVELSDTLKDSKQPSLAFGLCQIFMDALKAKDTSDSVISENSTNE